MGVPKFYRWLSERYPLVNQKIGKDVQFLPEFDGLSLDMNGLIHNCTHPNDEEVSGAIGMKTMVLNMFSYIDRMVKIVRPKKYLFLAVDGCAPRAKMNQQRSRRFASARDRRESLNQAVREGKITEEEIHEQFDSNCITPGTEFMETVSTHFKYFIRRKIKEDPVWRNLKVIYSGHDVPGEGEHKIMDYIRHTRMQPGADPNTRHCLAGLDADLIMLGLASHEPHFALLREEVDFTGGRGGKKGGSQTTKEVKKQVEQDKWELLHLSALRQYMDLEFRSLALPFEYNLERIIDDWVLLIMLVGNDFLPHLPTMSIAEGGLDELIEAYKKLLPTMSGYMTENGKVNFDRLELMLASIGNSEAKVFQNREKEAKKYQKRERRFAEKATTKVQDLDEETELAEVLEETFDGPYAQQAREKGILQDTSGFKEKYYAQKFGVTLQDKDVIDRVVHFYCEGLQWCYLYYYQGVPSWTWFFPFHYAPLASDMKNLSGLNIKLSKGKPFKPFMQLLSCLPADSAWCLPECYRQLMILDSSPLAEFYPREFQVDMNGKRNSWEGVNLLPFIDEKKLTDAVEENCPDEKLTEAERNRNSFGIELIFELDTSNTSTVKSTAPEYGLPDISTCQSSVRRFLLPPMEKFIPNLLPGCVADGRWPGDPQLITALTLQSDNPGKLEKAGVCCFNRASTRQSLIVNVQPPALAPLGQEVVNAVQQALSVANPEEDNLALPIVKALEVLQRKKKERLTVYVDYPNLREAQVMAIADDSYVYDLREQGKNQFNFVKNVQTEVDSETFFQYAEVAEERSVTGIKQVGTGGVRIGEVEVMIKVRPLLRMEVDPSNGSTKQIYAEDETWVPHQLVCYKNDAPDPRFQPRKPLSPEERFPLKSKIMCVQKLGYGLVGTVVGYEKVNSKTMLKAEFKEMSPQIPPFGHTIANSIVDQYISSGKAAKHFGIDSSTLGKITGSVLVRPGRFDLGLNLKVGRNYIIAGYVRSRSSESNKPPWSTGDSVTVISGLDPLERAQDSGRDLSQHQGGWEYSSRALELVATYKKKFPMVFNAIQARPDVREYEMKDIFGSGPQGKEVLNQVCKWLEQIDTFRLPLVPTTSKSMSRDAIIAVQRASDEVRKAVLDAQKDSKVLVKLSPNVVIKYSADSEAEWLRSPTSGVPPRLGDRVANLGSPVVPFGLGGTVVATHASTGCCEVVFDTEFVGGTSLYGACGNNRGKLLPWIQLLNLSNRVFLTPSVKASATTTPAKKGNPKSKTQQPQKQKQQKEKKVDPKTSRSQRKQAATTRGKNEAVQRPDISKPSKFVVEPAAPSKQDLENFGALQSLAPGVPGQVAPNVASSGVTSKGGDDDDDDLMKFWDELEQSESKSSRRKKNRKAKKEKEQTQKQPELKSEAPVAAKIPASTEKKKKGGKQAKQSKPLQPLPPPPQPVKLMKPPEAQVQQTPVPPPAAPVPAPVPTPAPASAPVSKMEELFQRATKATGKEYKKPVNMMPAYGAYQPPPQYGAVPPAYLMHQPPNMLHQYAPQPQAQQPPPAAPKEAPNAANEEN